MLRVVSPLGLLLLAWKCNLLDAGRCLRPVRNCERLCEREKKKSSSCWELWEIVWEGEEEFFILLGIVRDCVRGRRRSLRPVRNCERLCEREKKKSSSCWELWEIVWEGEEEVFVLLGIVRDCVRGRRRSLRPVGKRMAWMNYFSCLLAICGYIRFSYQMLLIEKFTRGKEGESIKYTLVKKILRSSLLNDLSRHHRWLSSGS